jgi:DMSO/TMAO reductase YedYZ molybdopterin-dependent catalytic subunit
VGSDASASAGAYGRAPNASFRTIMSIINPGFTGRRRGGAGLPPGQYLTTDFPVLSAGPTPRVNLPDWEFVITNEAGKVYRWDWEQFRALEVVDVTTDIHCVTRWSKLQTAWRGVSLDVLLAGVETQAGYALAYSYGDYTTNVPLPDLRGGKAWVAFEFDGKPLAAEHGGPARLLVPHLYFWKSAKWVRGLTLTAQDRPGFWESLGYHDYGDPWREQRYQGD